jgi:hypothetical protein
MEERRHASCSSRVDKYKHYLITANLVLVYKGIRRIVDQGQKHGEFC